ncbi:hypothetical protein BS78_06G229000 [Paspalum vaginatum]|nr:hypothetical protein BS78_06G229000 [Paspalum vaginatum]
MRRACTTDATRKHGIRRNSDTGSVRDLTPKRNGNAWWRGLWSRVSALRFASKPEFLTQAAAAERYTTFVNDALALRAAAGTEQAVEHLAVSLKMKRYPEPLERKRERGQKMSSLVLPSVDAAHGWIRYAVQHGLRSLAVKLRLPARAYRHGFGLPVMLLGGLPSSEKLETMCLGLGGATVALPAAAQFASLTDLSLERIVIADGGGDDSFARLLSSACCPRLQKLRLANLTVVGPSAKLVLEADALSELWMERITQLEFLELRTPNLRVLDIKSWSCDHLEALTIAAPRLEELTCLCLYLPLPIDVIGALSCVWNLKLELYSHSDSDDDEINDDSLHLLRCCSSVVRCLDVSLQAIPTKEQIVDLIEGRIPQLPHLTSFTIHASLWDQRSLGAGIASLLAQCGNLRYLGLHLEHHTTRYLDLEDDPDLYSFVCDRLDAWKSHAISLVHLQEVELKGLIGSACELRFIQFVLAGAKELQKVTLSSNPEYWWLQRNKDAFKLVPLQGNEIWKHPGSLANDSSNLLPFPIRLPCRCPHGAWRRRFLSREWKSSDGDDRAGEAWRFGIHDWWRVSTS